MATAFPLVRDPSSLSQRKTRMSPLSQRPERLLSEKDQSISPQTVSWATSPRYDQGFSNCQRPKQFLPEKDQGVSPQSETWGTSPRETPGCLPSETWGTLSRKKKAGHLPSWRDLGDFSQRKTRASPLDRELGDFSQEWPGSLPSET